jgi:O-antigen ligase
MLLAGVYAARVHETGSTGNLASAPWGRWTAATFLWLLATAGPVLWVRTRWSLDGDIAEDPFYLVLFLGAGLVCLVTVARDRSRLEAIRMDPERRRIAALTLALTTLLTLSTLWSLDPALTFTHGLRFVGTIAVALVLATFLTSLEQMTTLWVAVHIGSAWSFVQIFRLAEGSQDDRENWVGIFVNRNLLGLICGVGLTVGLLLAVHVRRTWVGRERIAALVVLAGAALVDLRLLWGSGSATPVGVLVLSSFVVGLVVAARRWAPQRWTTSDRVITGAAVVLSGLVVLSALLVPAVAGVFGRGGDLSRRVPLWDFVQDKIADRPLWGWGYLGGWEDRQFLRDMREFVRGKDLVSAHNSTLEVMLGAGVVALAVFVALLVLVTRSCLRTALTRGGGVVSLWPLVALLWFLFESVTETFLVADSLPTVLLFVAAFHAAPHRTGPESATEPAHDLGASDGGVPIEAAAFADQPGRPDGE